MSYVPTTQQIVTANNQGIVRIWDISGQQLTQFNTDRTGFESPQSKIGPIIKFSSNGDYIAIAGIDGITEIRNISGELLAQWESHKNIIINLCFTPDGQYLVTASADGTAKLWNLEGQLVTEFKGNNNWIWGIACSPNGQYIVTTGEDDTVIVWNLSGEAIAHWQCYHEQVLDIAYSPDGNYIATTGVNGSIRVWDHRGYLWATFQDDESKIWSIAFSPEGNCIAATGQNSDLTLWPIENLEELISKSKRWLKDYFKSHRLNNNNSIDSKQEDHPKRGDKNNPQKTEFNLTSTFKYYNNLISESLQSTESYFWGEFLIYDYLVKIYFGDIKNLLVDVLVKSDNNYLTMHDSFSKQIRNIGGEEIYRESRKFIPLSIGDIVATAAGDLAAHTIFHSVVKDISQNRIISEEIIASIVEKSLKKAKEDNIKSIAFTLLGTETGSIKELESFNCIVSQLFSSLRHIAGTNLEIFIVFHKSSLYLLLDGFFLKRMQSLSCRKIEE